MNPEAEGDFLSAYLRYTSNTEVPAFFNRWSAIAGIGALLGRQYFIHHGHFSVNPNIYCMLIGSAGTRKSSAIKMMRKLLISSGYTSIAASKTTKEKFLLDLSGAKDGTEKTVDDLLDSNIFGESAAEDAECFIMADEFNDFFGNGNIEFISLLGNLWDFEGVFESRIKNGNSIAVNNPTVSILGGNTPTGFSLAFPTEVLGQGFFSRILLIYGEPNGKRIAFPELPSTELTGSLLNHLKTIKARVFGEAELTQGAKSLLTKIYAGNFGVDDVRFDSYSNRRFQHLLKLCLIVSASRISRKIEERDVIYANTILVHTEFLMPRALGEFGRAKNSDVSHTVLELILRSRVPIGHLDVWKHVSTQLNKPAELADIFNNLKEAGKIQYIKTHKGWLPVRKERTAAIAGMVDFSLLTPEEREGTENDPSE